MHEVLRVPRGAIARPGTRRAAHPHRPRHDASVEHTGAVTARIIMAACADRGAGIMNEMATVLPPPQTSWPLPSRTQRDGRHAPSRAQRLALVSLLALLAAAAVAMAASFAWPWAVYEDRLFHAGRSEQFPRGTVTSFAPGAGYAGSPGFHIVRLDDGELFALLDSERYVPAHK